MNTKLIETFKNPTKEYRGKPFWAWNGKLDPQELRRQINIMKKMGLGGFFMHARVGLNTAYLSDEWFDCVKACVDEAKKTGMEAWLYDEDRWPSGAAGGLVTKNPAYRQRLLVMHTVQKSEAVKLDTTIVAVFRVSFAKNKIVSALRLGQEPEVESLKKNESLLVFLDREAACSSWYNGYTYLDTMNPDAVKEFINVTHNAYKKNVGDQFGATIPGIFTDEPFSGIKMAKYNLDGTEMTWAEQCASDCKKNQGISVPWTVQLPASFQMRFGYEISDHLPELFYDYADNSHCRTRYHYHECTTHLFVNSFARQIGEWCESNGLPFTGHVLNEESLYNQMSVVGSAMRFYEHMQIPGIDMLGEFSREFDTAKQVSSVARQFGKKWRITETYGCTGWEFPFSGHKAMSDWQVALGINLRCQHLYWYTMDGEAKRDYPACIGHQSPWWEQYGIVEDYFARIHTIMSRGEEVRDVLVIHPMESMWLLCNVDKEKASGVAQANQSMPCVRDWLLANHFDFDYGDEEILSRYTRIEKTADGPRLWINKAVYKAVVVPPMITIRKTTLDVLHEFAASGGTVVFAGTPPCLVDAVDSDAAIGCASNCTEVSFEEHTLITALSQKCPRRISIADALGKEIGQTLYILREDPEAQYLFLCNVGYNFKILGSNLPPAVIERKDAFPVVKIRLHGPCNGIPYECDPQTGEVLGVDSKQKNNVTEIITSLPKLGSRIFVFPKNKGAQKLKRHIHYIDKQRIPLADRQWNYALSDHNVCVLEIARYKIDKGKWMPAEEVLKIDGAIRDALGIKRRGGEMVQPWAREKQKTIRSIPVALSFSFDAKEIPAGPLYLGIEDPSRWAITLNNNSINTLNVNGWWTDESCKTLVVDPLFIKRGKNELIVEGLYDEECSGLEMVYLLGNFGASVNGRDITLYIAPKTLKLGDWGVQGFRFYGGSINYINDIKYTLKKGKRLFVQVPQYRGVAVQVFVDGASAGTIAWEPNEVDITDLCCKKSSFTLGIQVVGHRRNSHGPFHHVDNKWIGPGKYVSTGDDWQYDYHLVPCGLMKPPALVVKSVV